MSSDIHSDDKQLVDSIIADPERFEVIITTYKDPLVRYCMRMLSWNQDDAEDCVAETFAKAYMNLNGYNPQYKLSSWLYRIAHNNCVSLIRKKSKFFMVDHMEKVERPVDDHPSKPSQIDIDMVLHKLKPADRTILTLFYIQDMPIKDIADVLKITANSVAVKLNRARKKAKKLAS